MGNVKEVYGVWVLGSRFLAQVCLYVDIRLITSPCTAHTMCVCDKTLIINRILIGSSLVIYVGSDKKEITCTEISTQKRFVNVSFEKNFISESKITIIKLVSSWMKNDGMYWIFFLLVYRLSKHNIQNKKGF